MTVQRIVTAEIDFGPLVEALDDAIALGDVSAPACNGRYVLDHSIRECSVHRGPSADIIVESACVRCGWKVHVKLIAMSLLGGGRLEFVSE